MTKKLLCVLLMLAMILSVITACTSNTDPKDTDTEAESTGEEASSEEETSTEEESTSEEESTLEEESSFEEETEEPSSFLPLVLKGVSGVNVIYPSAYKAVELEVAQKLVDYIAKAGGATPGLKVDTERVDSEKLQILVGDTKRTEESLRSAKLGTVTYALQLTENGLVVNAGSGDALKFALTKLQDAADTYGSFQEGSLFLPDTALKTAYAGALSECLFTFAEPTNVLECGDQSYMLYFENMSVPSMYDYLAHLEANGFAEKEPIRAVLNHVNNLYSTYSNGKATVTVFYTANENACRVIVDPVETNGYASYVNDNTEKVCEPIFLQVGLNPEGADVQNGMCYIFRFSNGEFFIFDGGTNDKSFAEGQNCQRIVAMLKEYAVDANNIHIAGWLVTHPHTDHIGALEYFCNNYANDKTITLENVLINNPADSVADQDTSSTGLAKKINKYREALEKVVATGTKLHKTHPGQVLHFGADATLEILYTHELRMPETLYGSNNLSIVSRFTVEGQTYLFTGDTHTYSNRVMQALYDGSLKCDFYQTPHHGFGSNTNTLARDVDPRWVLWPVGPDVYESAAQKTHNKYLFSSDSRVEQMFVAKFRTYVFELPFTGSNFTVFDNTAVR
ncbi:MAG: MBL fold metallo-hydrolase [Clostridia bacterium]|nr:MBL fold metallo-hydrolase [Clostridia bacterium]